MKFSFVRFIGSFGVPTGSSQHTDKVSKNFKSLVQAQISLHSGMEKSALKGTYLAHLLDAKLPGQANDFIWSHLAHLILSSHAQFVSCLSWTFYNMQLRLDSESTSSSPQSQSPPPPTPTLSFKKSCISETTRRYAPAMTSMSVAQKVVFENGCVLHPGMTVFVCPASVYLDAKVFPYLHIHTTFLYKSNPNHLCLYRRTRILCNGPQIAGRLYPLFYRPLMNP